STDFIKIEKNLAALGFFTPSSKKIKNVKEKTISFMRVIDGNKVDTRVAIVPAAKYGLPITSDQDTYFAIFKIATEIHRQKGRVTNPIGFTSAEILHLQDKSAVSGFHYKELDEQLMRMLTTTIISEGAVYLAGRRVWAKDAFHVFDRVVMFGKAMDDGTIADKNYVWLSEWQLENINNNYLLPVDFETYKRLKSHIAKALVPLLQVWLYASRDEGCFEKRYDELCQILSVRQYKHLSQIKLWFAPSLDELKAHGYLATWKIVKTSDGGGFKILFYHGEKFHRDRHRRLAQRAQKTTAPELRLIPGCVPPKQQINESRIAALTDRGIAESRARKLLLHLADNQHVLDQLEWGDHLIAKEPGKFYNPAGFYIYLIEEGVAPPANFESSRIRGLREEARQASARAREEEARLELAYEEYQNIELDRYLSENYPASELAARVEAKKKELLRQYRNMSSWDADTLSKLAITAVRSEIAKRVPFLSFESFRAKEKLKD
ncbi:MAG TPA: replication initiator protein A, partial [Blastocatellia bacterium]